MAKYALRTTLYGKSQMEVDVFHALPFQAIDELCVKTHISPPGMDIVYILQNNRKHCYARFVPWAKIPEENIVK